MKRGITCDAFGIEPRTAETQGDLDSAATVRQVGPHGMGTGFTLCLAERPAVETEVCLGSW